MTVNKLFKYRPWNRHTKNIICNQKLYFSQPIAFNDPFDGQFTVMLDRYPLNDDRSPEVVKTFTQENIARIRSSFGVCCFSSEGNDILLWAHYADGHRGVCLIFEKKEIFNKAQPVNYTDSYPQVPYLNNLQEIANLCMLTKYSRWAYEQEYRIILPGKVGTIDFSAGLLKGIILGCSMSLKTKEEIYSLVRAYVPSLTLYQAKIKTQCFGLDIIRLN